MPTKNMNVSGQKDQKKTTQKHSTNTLIQSNPNENKNLFLKDKKTMQPMTEPHKSFNKNK